MRRKTTSVVACLAALALALPAAATSADTADTLISHGYDAEKAQLLFTVLDAEEAEEAGEYECVEPAGDGATGDTATDEEIAEADPVDGDETNGESDDTADDFECELTAVDVTGPAGQVNHGTVVSSVVHVLKSMGYKGIGCIVRVFAQSDYGKGDQQVKVSDDSDDKDSYDNGTDIVVEDPDATSEESTTELEESLTTCRQGDKDGDRRDKDDEDEDEDKDDEDEDRRERKSEDRAEKKGKPFGDDHPSAKKGRNGRGGDKDDDKSDGPKKQKSEQKSENTGRGGPDGKGSERGMGKPGK